MMLRVFSLCLVSALAALAGDLNGKWLAKVQGPNGELEVTYVLKVEEGKISGTASSHMGEMKISTGTVTGDDVVFTLDVNMNGEERKVEHKGKLAGDDLNMTIVIGEQTMEIKAKRSAS
jgi:hypothetical protein